MIFICERFNGVLTLKNKHSHLDYHLRIIMNHYKYYQVIALIILVLLTPNFFFNLLY